MLNDASMHSTPLTKLTKDICGFDERVPRGSRMSRHFSRFLIEDFLWHITCFASIALPCHFSIVATHTTTHTYVQTVFQHSAHGRAANLKAPGASSSTAHKGIHCSTWGDALSCIPPK